MDAKSRFLVLFLMATGIADVLIMAMTHLFTGAFPHLAVMLVVLIVVNYKIANAMEKHFFRGENDDSN